VKLLPILIFARFAASAMAEIPPEVAVAVAEVDSLSSITDIKPEATSSPAADRLAEELKLDMSSKEDANPAAIEILKQKMCINPSWQIAALTLAKSYPRSRPDKICADLCVNALNATLKADKDWDYYNGPRRQWWSPDMFRTRMAVKLLYAKTGRPYGFDAINQKLLSRDLEAWLAWVNSLESPIPPLRLSVPALEKIPEQAQSAGNIPGTTQALAIEPKEPSSKAKPYRIGAIISASLAALIGLLLLLKRRKS
jgi:hypothetical protein